MLEKAKRLFGLFRKKKPPPGFTKEELQVLDDLLMEISNAHELASKARERAKKHLIAAPSNKPIIYKPPKYL